VTALRTMSLALVGALTALSAGCGTSAARRGAVSLADLKSDARSSSDPDVVGRWALAEMYAPGGTAGDARAARARLESLPHAPMWASLARAVYDDAHGDPRAGADGYVGAATASASSGDDLAPLVGWFAVRHLLSLRSAVANLYEHYRGPLDGLLQRPGHLGWRAVADLEEWRAAEAYDKAERTGAAYDDEVTARMGCARGMRIAGPFGHGADGDAARSFAAEAPEPWPPAWPADPMRGSVPRVLAVVQTRCLAAAQEQVEDGVFYVESFFTTRGDREIVVAVQGAVSVWVDGALVLNRGPYEWGSWQRFGAHVAVGDGRHRVLARTATPAASIRLLNPDGTSAGLAADVDPRAGFTLRPPVVLSDPNPIDAIVRAVAANAPSGASPAESALAAYAAHADQMDDVAAALVEPFVAPADAGPLALEMAAAVAPGDMSWPEDTRGPRAQSLRVRALARDPRLWRTNLASVLDGAEQHGLPDAVEPLRKLAADFPNEPEVLEQLAQLWARLGWHAEQMRALADLAGRFPDDVGALHVYLDALDDQGPADEADKVAARIRRLDPDSEVDLDRAIARHDFATAVSELRRIEARRPDRKDIANRIADVLARSGDPSAAVKQLEKALEKHPRDQQARFRIADREYAKGDASALRRALAAALQAKSKTDELRAAIDLIEGSTDLEPFRRDGRAIIKDYQAWEAAGHHMDGTAARVLDYSAIWVHDDGSSEMLEHEIQKVQSEEAVHNESETEPPAGLVLHLRVVKPDGRVLEPEPIAGKPTLTLPNLEVGDFVEMEHITSEAGDGAHGRQYAGPHWFFREADKGYWRSEFVVVTPANRQLEIESRGPVPPPETRPMGTFVERRWRVDLSPPAELEPESPPITEFLPSVRVGWGVSPETTLARLVDLAADTTPLDPRLRTLALEAVGDAPPAASGERARRLYRWVLSQIQDGKETDGRRVINGKSGSRQSAFRYLLRLVGIDSELAVVRNRLATPPVGPMSEVEQYDALVLRVVTDQGVRWMTVRDKFAPFGYVPAEWRDQPAIRLVEGMPHDRVLAPGAVDRVAYQGRADVREDGAALLDLTLVFDGNRAIAWRSALDQIPQAKLYDFIERELIAPSFDGGHVREMTTEAGDALDKPLVMHLRVEVPGLAKPVGAGLALRPPFAPNLGQLAALPSRRTPLLRPTAWRAEIHLRVVFPPSMRPPTTLPAGRAHDGDAYVEVKDTVNGHAIDFDRVVDLPSGRVQPGDEYAAWQAFVRKADLLLTRDVLVGK
jgi:cellulose synthase operon protein C